MSGARRGAARASTRTAHQHARRILGPRSTSSRAQMFHVGACVSVSRGEHAMSMAGVLHGGGRPGGSGRPDRLALLFCLLHIAGSPSMAG